MGIPKLTCISFNVLCILCLIHVIWAQEEPEFVFQPTQVKCTEGQECVLVCAAKNIEIDELKWQRNKDFVSSLNKESKYVEEITVVYRNIIQNMLIIKYVDRGDAKYFYRCIINSDKIPLYSNNGTLEVAEVPPSHYPICSPKQTYSVGDYARLTCTTEKTQNSKVSLDWFQNKVRIKDSIKQREENGKIISELTLQVTAADKGSIFVCFQILDVLDQVNKSCVVGPLDITFGPIVSISGPASIPLNGEALYVCSNMANPPTTVNEWLEPELPNTAYSLENHKQVLRISRATLNMNRTLLRCIAVNSVGRVEETFTLIVQSDDRPLQTSRPAKTTTDSTHQIAPDISKILSVAGMCLLLTAVLIGLLLCYLQFCKFGLFPMPTNEERIAQPEVYFEPKDNIRCTMSPYDDNDMYYKRNVAIQVTPGVDTDSVYAEVEDGKKT